MGTAISVSIVEVVSSCLNWTAGQATHGCNLREKIKDLNNDWDELEGLMNDIQTRIDLVEGAELRRLNQVQGWLRRVEDMKEEVEKLVEDSTQDLEITCCRGCCARNCKTRHKLGRKVAKKLKQVADLKSRGIFHSVVEKLPPKPMAARYSEPTVGLESMIDEVWRYITADDQVGIIGLYGMGGVGKTTLLTEINNKLSKAPHDFDLVIWASVHQNPSLQSLQEEIGKKIGYRDTNWTNKRHDEKAEDIFSFLSKKKFVLLLDDIWERFDLKEVGVPLPNEENKSKVVFTTRSRDVCGRMEAQKMVSVECLAPNEAWDLFMQKVGRNSIIDDHPEILKLAKLVVQECAGLPLALITIGRSMACKKSPHEWSHALKLLRKNAAQFTGMEVEVFRLLKFSYDSLRGDDVRSCFLYCSLFPRDSYIPKQKLINYWLGEGFLNTWDDFNEAKFQGYHIIGTLIHACLLEEDENDGVTMHDVIRDMAVWIACDCGTARDKFLVQARAGLREVPELKWKGIERISLTSNQIKELEEVTSCHNLLTLFLNDNRLNMIAQGFFQSMRALRVLDLSGNEGITELPEDISLLVSLQYLNLAGTSITKLPIELQRLRRLKYLDLTHTHHLHKIPLGLISSFENLEVLKMFGCGSDLFEEESPSYQVDMVVELTVLRLLKNLSISIRSSSAFFSICSYYTFWNCISRLGLSHLKLSKNTFSKVFCSWTELERLEIVDCEFDYLEFMWMRDLSNFRNLHSVFIVRCSAVKNLTWVGFTQRLELLVIAYCKDTTEIIGDHSEDEGLLFPRLKELYLIELPQLCSIYSKSLPFPYLKFIGVEGCPRLTDLPLDSESAKGGGLTIQGSEDWWNGLTTKSAASFIIIDAKEEEEKKKAESSSSTSTADASLPYFKSFD